MHVTGRVRSSHQLVFDNRSFTIVKTRKTGWYSLFSPPSDCISKTVPRDPPPPGSIIIHQPPIPSPLPLITHTHQPPPLIPPNPYNNLPHPLHPHQPPKRLPHLPPPKIPRNPRPNLLLLHKPHHRLHHIFPHTKYPPNRLCAKNHLWDHIHLFTSGEEPDGGDQPALFRGAEGLLNGSCAGDVDDVVDADAGGEA